MRHLPCEFLAGKTNEVCAWNHGNVGQTEPGYVMIFHALYIVDGNGGGYERPEDIYGSRQPARRSPGDGQKLEGMYASSTRLSGRLHADKTSPPPAMCAVHDLLSGLGKRRVAFASMGASWDFLAVPEDTISVRHCEDSDCQRLRIASYRNSDSRER